MTGINEAMYPIEGPQFNWRVSDDLGIKKVIDRSHNLNRALSNREGVSELAEKLVGGNNLRSISFLEQGVSLSKSVAHISLAGGRGVATGFMIRPDLLLTNWHVFETAEDARGSVIRFNYQRDLEGNMLATDNYECDPDTYFHANETLDYAIVSIKGDPGFKWGTVRIDPNANLQKNQDIIIIQHPMGMPKQIAITDNQVVFVGDSVAQYLTDTMPGSSGSPVFDDHWRLVALHHSGGWIPEPGSHSRHFRNEGILISAIAADLPISLTH